MSFDPFRDVFRLISDQIEVTVIGHPIAKTVLKFAKFFPFLLALDPEGNGDDMPKISDLHGGHSEDVGHAFDAEGDLPEATFFVLEGKAAGIHTDGPDMFRLQEIEASMEDVTFWSPLAIVGRVADLEAGIGVHGRASRSSASLERRSKAREMKLWPR